ncbi:type II toxin-antitoxin system RelE/ParE family toxin [Candidatus Micrarchaeota archaeon]|nr:type II toxin-antitoxin system RelE/ParE family toxin [Candidatus Micrarchaeota archaeon]
MDYVLHFSNHWEKNYKKLNSTTKDNAKEALPKIMENPYVGKPLTGNLKGLWSFRIGKYRILYEINEERKIIFIEAVGLRKNIYD